MKNLHAVDIIIIAVYLGAMILMGFYFSGRNKTARHFTRASGNIPGWAIGLSLYATFLSSNTFLGVPGKAFGSNWNAFVFSLSIPLAAWIASRYFVPFYRRTGEISAYTHLENRFGPWARTYSVICFLLMQIARIGTVFFGIAITLQAVSGYNIRMIILVVGACIIIYTVFGGIEAVIWTEVIQACIKTFGAVLILYLLVRNIPGGLPAVLSKGMEAGKFSLGSISPDFTQSTFWVVLLYGFFMNLNNFGIDQNYIQRYHTASSDKSAGRSVWLCAWLYIPVSLLFFLIGTSLYLYVRVHPEFTAALADNLKAGQPGNMIIQNGSVASASEVILSGNSDKVLPFFMATRLPAGVAGLVISALLAAGMSTISSGMNACATSFSADIWKRYLSPFSSDRQELVILRSGTVVFGLLGLGAAAAMSGVSSILDVWWKLSGIFAGSVLGLFLLGIVTRIAGNTQAIVSTLIGLLIIVWMTFSPYIPEEYAYLRSMFHESMIITIGTLTVFLTGMFLSAVRKNFLNLDKKR